MGKKLDYCKECGISFERCPEEKDGRCRGCVNWSRTWVGNHLYYIFNKV